MRAVHAPEKRMSRFTRRNDLVNAAFRQRLAEIRLWDRMRPVVEEMHNDAVRRAWRDANKEVIRGLLS